MAEPSIYDRQFVAGLFDGMAATYGLVNVVSSFGFCVRWRRQCADLLPPLPAGAVVVDLMSGMGELWPNLAGRMAGGTIHAVDISGEMGRRAGRRRGLAGDDVAVSVLRADALACPMPDGSADAVVSSFGLKTFSPQQQRRLAGEVARLLRPGGVFAFVEISRPPARLLRPPYEFYISRVIPLLGRLALGDPECYRMLGVYTRAFGDAGGFAAALRGEGLSVAEGRLFFGCATLVRGARPG